MDMRIAKKELREAAKKRRLSMSRDEVDSASQRIVKQLINNVNWSLIDVLHTYLPIKKNNEVNTWLLVDWIRQNQPAIDILVPIYDGKKLTSHQIMPDSEFKEDDLGIPNPKNTEPSELAPELIIAPCLMADRSGYRLGNGSGHYDEFLGSQNANSIALCYQSNLTDHLPIEPHDIAVSAVATENEFVQTSSFNVGV